MRLHAQQKQKIIDYFHSRLEVAGVYLYGSQARDKAGPLSDVDIAVLMSSKTDKDNYFDFQLEYISKVQSILNVDLAADVKILNGNQALAYQASVISEGELIVKNRPAEVESFTHRIAMLYPDFYPVLQNYYSQMNQRLTGDAYAA